MKIVGVGAGRNLLTAEAIDTIENASVVYGSKRAIKLAKDHIRCDCHEIEDYKRISELPDGAVVLSTGDPMLSGLGRFAKADDTIVPGISSMQIVSARLKIEQTELAAVTAHARDINRAKEMILSELELGKTVFVLPDARFDLQEVSKFLLDRGFAIPVAVCEQVAYPDERIAVGTTENPPKAMSDLFSVVIGSAINRGDRKMAIGVLGPAGTFSEQAAKRWSTEPDEFVYFSDVGEIAASVGNRLDFGVIPVENSLEGSVGATLDALLKYNVTIVGEIIRQRPSKRSSRIHRLPPSAGSFCRGILAMQRSRWLQAQHTPQNSHRLRMALLRSHPLIPRRDTVLKYFLKRFRTLMRIIPDLSCSEPLSRKRQGRTRHRSSWICTKTDPAHFTNCLLSLHRGISTSRRSSHARPGRRLGSISFISTFRGTSTTMRSMMRSSRSRGWLRG